MDERRHDDNSMSPTRPRYRCIEVGCRNISESDGRCEQHRKAQHKEKDRNRGGTDPFYYSTPWRKLRTYVLSREPLCRICKQAATDLDHITQRSKGGSDFDLTNLQPLCRECHARKRNAESRGGEGGL